MADGFDFDVDGSGSEIQFLSEAQDDPQKRKPDIKKAKLMLGWEPVALTLVRLRFWPGLCGGGAASLSLGLSLNPTCLCSAPAAPFQPQVPLEEGLNKAIHYFRKELEYQANNQYIPKPKPARIKKGRTRHN
ncbi:UDP-glucuronic acid decarboxylase 1 [Saguinus oedipus]|uniref:UDP-glucuronic acid decarboxylase 1 n=1 Tax=Saguinus oedipus TaxID=9490 RepID=A0ABQ9U9E7_SAGOE|nr:UDP-glucuronic acid decarboxylase 1 [Saguinus oedipus]